MREAPALPDLKAGTSDLSVESTEHTEDSELDFCRHIISEELYRNIQIKKKNIRDSRSDLTGLSVAKRNLIPKDDLSFEDEQEDYLRRKLKENPSEVKRTNLQKQRAEYRSPKMTATIDAIRASIGKHGAQFERAVVSTNIHSPNLKLKEWRKLSKLQEFTLYYLLMRHSREHIIPFTLILGRDVQKSLRKSSNQSKYISERINRELKDLNAKDVLIWFCLEDVENSNQSNIGEHLHGFIACNEISEELIGKAMRKAGGEIKNSMKPRQFEINRKLYNFVSDSSVKEEYYHDRAGSVRDGMRQTLYRLKEPMHLYVCRDLTKLAKDHYKKLRNAINTPTKKQTLRKNATLAILPSENLCSDFEKPVLSVSLRGKFR